MNISIKDLLYKGYNANRVSKDKSWYDVMYRGWQNGCEVVVKLTYEGNRGEDFGTTGRLVEVIVFQ